MRKNFRLIVGVLPLVGAVIVPIVTTIITFILPSAFVSSARILPVVSGPTAVATEIAIIRSQATRLPATTLMATRLDHTPLGGIASPVAIDAPRPSSAVVLLRRMDGCRR
jgi:hypothetical protein